LWHAAPSPRLLQLMPRSSLLPVPPARMALAAGGLRSIVDAGRLARAGVMVAAGCIGGASSRSFDPGEGGNGQAANSSITS
jgi:cytosine/adenosine deaminase-related metal-dependent hydrolase